MSRAIRDNLPAVTFAVGAAAIIIASRYLAGGRGDSRPKAQVKSAPLRELPTFADEVQRGQRALRRESIAGESFTEQDLDAAERVVYPKSDETRAHLTKVASKLLLFRSLDARQISEIVDAMQEVRVPAGTAIIQQGDHGDNFYVVDTGLFNVLVNGTKVAQVGPGGGFGELALLYGQPRAATVKATTDAVVWSVDRQTFRRIVVASTMKKRREHDAFLREVPLLKSMSLPERLKAVDALQPVTFAAGEIIMREGESGDTFYIVEEGEVIVTRDENGHEVELARKGRGDYFGEIALLTDGVRVATVTAASDVTCLALDKASFDRLLGPCEDILKRNMANYQQYRDQLKA